MEAIQGIFADGEWLTAKQINATAATAAANMADLVGDWKSRGRIFSVDYCGKEYFASYQFDALCHPLPIIKKILAAFGEVTDAWTVAAGSHFPNAWLVKRDEGGAVSLRRRTCWTVAQR